MLVLLVGTVNGDELCVLGGKGDTLLHEYLMSEMRAQCEVRREAVEVSLRSAAAVTRRAGQLRERYRRILGPLPEKTPLNGKVTGTIPCDGYRIENVAYESRPNHHVTANLYIPTTGKPPYPGVLVPCGHSSNGKASDSYQRAAILLAKNGFVALVVDPICQGERFQILDATGKPVTRGGTTTHTLLDIGAMLTGTDVVREML